MKRREFLRATLALPTGASLAHNEALAAPAQEQIKITGIKVMQGRDPGTLIKIESDAGIATPEWWIAAPCKQPAMASHILTLR